MKVRISATINPETLKVLEKIVKENNYRNYSHAIEDAIKILKEVKNAKKK
jgi:Arc/MetJ-type ribon-helix-helix transcriptional regulator